MDVSSNNNTKLCVQVEACPLFKQAVDVLAKLNPHII